MCDLVPRPSMGLGAEGVASNIELFRLTTLLTLHVKAHDPAEGFPADPAR